MLRFRRVFVFVLLILALVVAPTRALAMPKKFAGCKQVTKSGITYLLYRDAAIVTKTKGKIVTIPHSIRAKGKRYVVRAIWDGALRRNKSLRKIDLYARLETCEDDTLFIRDHRNVRVIVHRVSDYRWIRFGESCCNSLVTLASHYIIDCPIYRH